MLIKIIAQRFMTAGGEQTSYGVVIDGVPRFTFYSEEEFQAFLRGINGIRATC